MRFIAAIVGLVATEGAIAVAIPAQEGSQGAMLGQQLVRRMIEAPHLLLPNSKFSLSGR
jgi:hypothetical protein